MSDYQPTEVDVRTAMLNRGFTEAEVSELLNNIKAEAWETAYRQGVEDERLVEVLQVDVGVGVPAQAARQNPYRGGQ